MSPLCLDGINEDSKKLMIVKMNYHHKDSSLSIVMIEMIKVQGNLNPQSSEAIEKILDKVFIK